RRLKEFGIRMALGAGRSSILRLVLRDVGAVLITGIAAGAVVSLAAGQLVEKMLFGLSGRDLTTLGAAAAVLALVSLMAGYVPVRRASRLEVMSVLRED